MYNRNSVDASMEPSRITATYFCEDFPYRTPPKPSITEKRQNKAKYLTWNPQDLSLWRKPAYQILSKTWISCATARGVASELIKALTILSDTAIKRSAVDRKDLKPYWKLELL